MRGGSIKSSMATGVSAQAFGRMHQNLQLFKLGVNDHFNPMPAVVTARY
jgi:hypothetical protein